MLGLVTIGQSPREDVVRSMFGDAPPRLTQAGALDDVTPDELAALAPRAGGHTLVTRLADGREVTVDKALLLPRLHEAVARVAAAGATVVCVLCTGEFPELSSVTRIVYPDRILSAVVNALAPTGRLGVLLPHPAQCDMMQHKWSRSGRDLTLACASPYVEADAMEAAGVKLASAEVELVVMDCMGFDRDMQARLAAVCAAPTLLANGLVGAVLRESVVSL